MGDLSPTSAAGGSERVIGQALREKLEAVARQGMVVAKQPPAALAGVAVLERGGNAVDAAVTAAFASGIVLPLATGLGGGGYLVFHDAASGRTHVVDYALQSAGAVHEASYDLHPAGGVASSSGWRRVRDDANWRGWRSISVPGAVAGLALALERFGTISLAAALAPAIELAEEGFPLSQELALELVRDWPLLCRHPATFALFTNAGRPRAPGERLRNPSLARTLRRLAHAGPDDFYRGQVAREIAADMGAHGGFVAAQDLATYQARVVEPLTGTYRGVTIHGAPGATGAITLLEILNILEGFDLGALGAGSAQALHLWIEASRLAFADRYQYLGDPAFVDAPWRGLASAAYAAERRAQLESGRALGARAAGDPWPYEGRPRPARAYAPSRPWEPGGTAHVGAVDSRRNLVALTDTLVSWSGVVLPRTGIVMNDGMMWFDPLPGRANSAGPGRRGLNNMAPLVLLRDGRPFATLGARGGRKIVGTVAQVVANLVDHGMGMQVAISAPKIDASEPAVEIDGRCAGAVRAALARLGHSIQVAPGRAGAGAAGILVDHATGLLHGGDDPFGEGAAIGYQR